MNMALWLACTWSAVGQITVATDFPGGCAEVVEIDDDARRVHIRPALQPGQGWPCWWYCRIDGVEAGKELTLQVSGQPGEFRNGSVLAANWAFPTQATWFEQPGEFQQTQPGKIEAKLATYKFVPQSTQVWVAWGPPYGIDLAEVDGQLKKWEQANAGNKIFLLSKTLNERPVYGVQIGQGEAAVWVQARQHAWEAGGSWVGCGFADWCVSEEPVAQALRKLATIYYVPVMDVDSVANGAGGKEAVPQDHNRDWSDRPHHPEVAAAQKKIQELYAAGRLRAFIDLHNPGPGDKQPFFYGPFDFEQEPAEVQQMYHRWLALASDEIVQPLPLFKQYRFATYVKTEEERQRMSSCWVRHHTGPEVLSTTLETSWNTPQSTREGYQAVGAGLAKALAKHVAEVEK